jgi:alkanesulfonate monooxygenase SsuD/methylene tetrahydromethanopterin reductase-like flavin-dependent oxidoreductase (luciferase family)
VNGAFGETEDEAAAKLATIPGPLALDHIRTRGLFGTPEMVRQRLWELEQSGVQEVILSRRSLISPEVLDFFAQFLL